MCNCGNALSTICNFVQSDANKAFQYTLTSERYSVFTRLRPWLVLEATLTLNFAFHRTRGLMFIIRPATIRHQNRLFIRYTMVICHVSRFGNVVNF